jgi:predicted DNA-binding transcriptional regulator AlpA
MSANAPVSPATVHSERDRLMLEREAAALLGYSPRALQNWRLRGGGPVFVKVSGRSIRYQNSDLMAWIAAKRRARTADPVPPPSDR